MKRCKRKEENVKIEGEKTEEKWKINVKSEGKLNVKGEQIKPKWCVKSKL
jgi:hypothetical protein